MTGRFPSQRASNAENISMSCCHHDIQHINGLVQERCNSSALTMELHLSCTNTSIYPSYLMELCLSCTNPLIYQSYFHVQIYPTDILSESLLSAMFLMTLWGDQRPLKSSLIGLPNQVWQEQCFGLGCDMHPNRAWLQSILSRDQFYCQHIVWPKSVNIYILLNWFSFTEYT